MDENQKINLIEEYECRLQLIFSEYKKCPSGSTEWHKFVYEPVESIKFYSDKEKRVKTEKEKAKIMRKPKYGTEMYRMSNVPPSQSRSSNNKIIKRPWNQNAYNFIHRKFHLNIDDNEKSNEWNSTSRHHRQTNKNDYEPAQNLSGRQKKEWQSAYMSINQSLNFPFGYQSENYHR